MEENRKGEQIENHKNDRDINADDKVKTYINNGTSNKISELLNTTKKVDSSNIYVRDV